MTPGSVSAMLSELQTLTNRLAIEAVKAKKTAEEAEARALNAKGAIEDIHRAVRRLALIDSMWCNLAHELDQDEIPF